MVEVEAVVVVGGNVSTEEDEVRWKKEAACALTCPKYVFLPLKASRRLANTLAAEC